MHDVFIKNLRNHTKTEYEENIYRSQHHLSSQLIVCGLIHNIMCSVSDMPEEKFANNIFNLVLGKKCNIKFFLQLNNAKNTQK